MAAPIRNPRAERAASANLSDPISVLVIDPSSFSRACTVAGLKSTAEFVIEACAAVAGCGPDIEPDLILFQSTEVGAAGSVLTSELTLALRRWPGAAALVVADHIGLEEMLATIRSGARGLLTSTTSVDCTRSAIRLLINGIGVYPAELAAFLHGVSPETAASGAGDTPFESNRLNTLTKRQQDVLHLLAAGSSNRAIAERLQISESTVKVHIRAIMALNGASNRTQIVAHFLKRLAHEQ
jgi:DNA-binding NarL/FixJ family response regulator